MFLLSRCTKLFILPQLDDHNAFVLSTNLWHISLEATPKGLQFPDFGLRSPWFLLVAFDDLVKKCIQDMVSLGDMIQHNPQVKARQDGVKSFEQPVICPQMNRFSSFQERLKFQREMLALCSF